MSDTKHILIIDDTEANRYVVARILKNAGYGVTEAATCHEGAQVVRIQPDLIILDVQLPDGNGYAFCRNLKSNADTSHIPVLMTSASFVGSKDKAHGLDSGADGYLTTPVDALELLATIKALLRVREMEEKLRKSQEIFQTMADSMPAMVWMSGTDKVRYYFNNAWLAYRGRTLEQEASNGWAEGIHPDDFQKRLDTYDACFDERKSFEIVYRLRRHDGEYRWILARGEPHYGLDGSFKGYTGACIDIHDKLLAEKKLQESEERFDLAVQGMSDGVWDWNIEEGTMYFSARYKSMVGYTDQEFPNTLEAAFSRIHPDDKVKVRNSIDEAVAGKVMCYKNIFRMRHKNGFWRWILSRGVPLRDTKGKVMRMVGGHTDITEQKETEQALRDAYKKAEIANNAKTEFLANMSHEIRTPMNAIIGLSNIMMSTPLDERQKKFITTLQLSAESLLTLINDMLDISKIEDNMIELERIPFSLSEVLEKVMSMMLVKANEKQLFLRLEYTNKRHDNFLGDPHRLQQIILNLVGNAIKFTNIGGITITVDEKPDVAPGSSKITIRVSDTGIGIPKEKHYSIFEKFTQGDSSITRKYGGTGLGLSISKALIARMEGNIHLASEPGKGAVFTINVPLMRVGEGHSKSVSSATPVQQAEPQGRNKKRILLVEDYPANILIASIVLDEAGYDYEVVTNGLEAIEKIQTSYFDAVIMDIQMQGIDGYETTQQIREWERKEKRLPLFIMAMTAHALRGDREKCLQAGMNDYISKPFNPVDLKNKLSTLQPDSEQVV